MRVCGNETLIFSVESQQRFNSAVYWNNLDFPHADDVIGVAGEQGGSISGPGKRDGSRVLVLAITLALVLTEEGGANLGLVSSSTTVLLSKSCFWIYGASR